MPSLRTTALGATLVAAVGAVQAHIIQLDDRDISRALNVANATEPVRKAFHARYFLAVQDPTVSSLEVVTEFRRYVLGAEAERRAGNWMVARGGYDRRGRTLKQILQPASGRVSIVLRLRFHPQNTYVFVPDVGVELGRPSLQAIDIQRAPQLAPANTPGERQPILGATVEAFFNASSIPAARVPLRATLDSKELFTTEIDFSRIE